MSVDGREEPRGGGGSEVEAGTSPARQVPAQREPGGRHARPSGSSGPGGTGGELPPSDGDLIARMRGGDDGAYEELFRRHADSVRRYARSCCRDAHTADDLTAEVFARTLQAVRGGAGPDQSVRAYLLTTVRRVAAAWAKTAKREQLVEDFAVFAEQASPGTEGGAAGLSGLSGLSGDDTLELGADVRAMHEAERSLAVQAFRSLPERWQAVLWHTTVEEASPSAIAPLFGLSANATAVLASRAREGLKQAYLQAHVSSALSEGGDCARYADRLGAYARGGLRMRAERGLRKHLEECVKCRLAAGELQDVNAGIPALLPVAVIGWFAAGYAGKAAGVLAGGAVAAGGAAVGGAAAAAAGGSTAGAGTAGATGGAAAGAGATGGAAGAGGGAGGSVAAEGLGLPAKAAIAAGIAVAAAAGVVFALAGDDTEPRARVHAAPSAAAPAVPSPPEAPAASPGPAEPDPPAQEPSAAQGTVAPQPRPTPSAPASAAPAPVPSPSPPPSTGREQPSPTPSPQRPSPTPPAPKPPQGFQLAGLTHSVYGDHSGPEVQTWRSGWVWQRHGLEVGGRRFAHGITVNSRSSVEITLNRQCTTFSAQAGVDGLSLFTDGAVRFSVYADGERLWQSAALGHEDPPAAVRVPLEGRRTLRLMVERAGRGSLPTLASWADAVLSCR
ncbi:sigma-70 family RNA polymerase sigma factor [Streptomyces sp. NPDC048331]|uniref:sigma-70 family RNA polymerase sigma factor n=1 Tax=Streptomyces sp. NPDC048331 TaxID=3365534 RepID=UPI003711E1DA